jgi:hypothetical protein
MPASIWAMEQETIRKKTRGKHGLLSMVFPFVTPVNTIRKNPPRGNLNKGSSLVKFPFLFFPSLFPFLI